MTEPVFRIGGEFWFSAGYASGLLGTTRKKVEAMAVRGLIRSREQGNDVLVAEADVTRLRRHPQELVKVKEAAKMPAYPKRSASMPRDTIYKGDPFNPKAKGAQLGRIGHPLKDEGRK